MKINFKGSIYYSITLVRVMGIPSERRQFVCPYKSIEDSKHFHDGSESAPKQTERTYLTAQSALKVENVAWRLEDLMISRVYNFSRQIAQNVSKKVSPQAQELASQGSPKRVLN